VQEAPPRLSAKQREQAKKLLRKLADVARKGPPEQAEKEFKRLRGNGVLPPGALQVWTDIARRAHESRFGTLLYQDGKAIAINLGCDLVFRDDDSVEFVRFVVNDLLAPFDQAGLAAYDVGKIQANAREFMERLNAPHYRPLRQGKDFPRPDIKQSDVVYVVGNGPSLATNGHLLTGVKNGAIITTNRAMKLVPGIKPTYHMIFEPRPGTDWFEGVDVSDTECIIDVGTADYVRRLPWKQIWWSTMGVPSGGKVPVACRYAERHIPGMLRFWHGMSVSLSALHLALMMKPKVVVLVGQDCCFLNGETHPGEGLKPDKNLIQMRDMWTGQPVTTAMEYKLIADVLMGAMVLVQRNTWPKGSDSPAIRFVNASGRGLIGGWLGEDYGTTHMYTVQMVPLETLLRELEP